MNTTNSKRLVSFKEDALSKSLLKRSRTESESAPFELNGVLKKSNKVISNIKLIGNQKYVHIIEMKALFSAYGSNQTNIDGNEINISSYVPLNVLRNVVKDNRTCTFMSIIPQSQMVEYSKLKCFLTVNSIAGVASHPSMPTVAFVVFPSSELRMFNYTSTTLWGDKMLCNSHELCAIYFQELPRRPKTLDDPVNYADDDNLIDENTESSKLLFTWDRVVSYLKFPEKLKELKSVSRFFVFGTSDTASFLRRITVNINKHYDTSKPRPLGKPINVMLFDRQDKTLFNKKMLIHKKHIETQVWEYGFPDSNLKSEIIPPCQVFPKNSGGYLTTDIQNIIQNPVIIDTISNEIRLLNECSLFTDDTSGWSFILPYNLISYLKEAMSTVDDIEKVHTAIIAISIALSKNTVQIIRIWPTETTDLNLLRFIETVEQCYYTNRQYFGYVDDINSVSESMQSRHLSIDFIKSSNIFSTYR
ncbi:MAG: hypothetical protein EXX96DRAFT_163966 [Benjaminiella poitrasii]|nr:MAG: hypothetical protein EXX96DRAFT_163966 [Benjaminiella poitrasii]